MFHPTCAMLAAVLAMAGLAATPAHADINVGVTLALTGPAASLGIPAKRAVDLLPKEIAGQKLNYILLDDTSDPSISVRNFRRLVDEHNVDVVMGSSVTPSTIALVDVAAETKVPLMSLAASARIVEPQDEKRRWAFKAIQNENLMIGATLGHMQMAGTKTLAFMGFSDAYGDAWLAALQPLADKAGIRLVATERYVRTDTSVVAQTLKIIAAKPDAVLVAASGTPGALPQKTLTERGYKGRVYQTYGIANRDFLRVAGKDAEGAIFAVGPVLVADQLDPGSPMRPVAQDFIKRYEAAYGQNSASIFAANVWDAGLVLRAAIPAALGKGRPGTEAFRIALRDALESTSGVVTTQGVTTMSRSDHVGYDERAAALVQIQNGGWKYLK
ncbi:receptor family ligand binding region family protein 17 [Cupriavidus basilensis OR16]|uniref:Receptor family ligand binding region family protein 17 n=1 Tax=Cupriavidus basilensis OR16 TaxID=1127483 RepID=H1SBC9_9BURK|nr:ABC transporter substrate-binding protein [Cupriavidus basilensis]EHP40200.1 receptor family ligand binding region family protein 17 [Cupriavidus basilensis OR16]